MPYVSPRGVSRIVRREVFRAGAVPGIICNEVERPVDCTFDSPELKVEGVFEHPNPPLDTPLSPMLVWSVFGVQTQAVQFIYDNTFKKTIS